MKAEDALKIAATAIKGVRAIHGLTGVGGDKAGEALAAIGAITQTLIDGLDGDTSPEVVDAALADLVRQISDNDAAADTALDAKFKGGK